MSWINEVMEATKELESPRSFWYWSSLATISAIVKDNVWLDRGGAYKLYPNIYVMLLAGSALKKGPPVGLAKTLAKKVNNTKVIVGRSSIQGILKELSTAQTQPGGKIGPRSTGFIVASEFSSSLVEDPAAFNLLTDLYDRHYNEGDYKSLLKQETFSLRDPTVSMLVATNEPHLRDFVGEKDVYGGFFGRIFVIKEQETNTLNSLIKQLTHPIDPDKLAEYLKVISALKGPFETLEGTAAGKIYDDWYHSFYGTIKKHKIEDKTGTLGRFGDSVLKVAMILALSEEPKLVISEDTMIEAIKVCEKFVEGVRKATLAHSGKQAQSAQKSMLIYELLEREGHQASRTALLRKFWMEITDIELDALMKSFDEAGMIKIHNINKEVVYVMPHAVSEQLSKMLEGKGMK